MRQNTTPVKKDLNRRR